MLLTCNLSCCLTGMAGWKRRFVLLVLTLSVGLGSEVTMTTMGGEPDATPICSNTTEHTVTLVVCKILTEGSGEECLLLFRYGGGGTNGHPCDSRFTLVTENQTVFLHLAGLTPVDSGNYTCQCSHEDGMEVLHLRITVQGKDVSEGDASRSTTHQLVVIGLIAATMVISITAVIFGCLYRGIRQRTRPPMSSFPNTEPEGIEPYSTFTQRENGLYSTATLHDTNMEDTRSQTLL